MISEWLLWALKSGAVMVSSIMVYASIQDFGVPSVQWAVSIIVFTAVCFFAVKQEGFNSGET